MIRMNLDPLKLQKFPIHAFFFPSVSLFTPRSPPRSDTIAYLKPATFSLPSSALYTFRGSSERDSPSLSFKGGTPNPFRLR